MRERKRRFRAALLGLLMLCALAQPALAGTITNNGAFQFGDGASMENGGSFVNESSGTVYGSGSITVEPGGTFQNKNDNIFSNGMAPSISNKAGSSGVSGIPASHPVTTYYAVTLDANGGKFSDGATTKTVYASSLNELGEILRKTSNSPTYTGNEFSDWYILVDNEPLFSSDITDSNFTDGMRVYAKWEAYYAVSDASALSAALSDSEHSQIMVTGDITTTSVSMTQPNPSKTLRIISGCTLTITNGAGSAFNLVYGSVINDGTIRFFNSGLHNESTFTNNGTIVVYDARYAVVNNGSSPSFTNTGTIFSPEAPAGLGGSVYTLNNNAAYPFPTEYAGDDMPYIPFFALEIVYSTGVGIPSTVKGFRLDGSTIEQKNYTRGSSAPSSEVFCYFFDDNDDQFAMLSSGLFNSGAVSITGGDTLTLTADTDTIDGHSVGSGVKYYLVQRSGTSGSYSYTLDQYTRATLPSGGISAAQKDTVRYLYNKNGAISHIVVIIKPES